MNVVAISGRITSDPELKQTQDGTSVCRFSVAVRRPNVKDKTDFIDCIAWRQKAEFVSRFFRKGQRIEVTGYLTARKWEDKHGAKRVSHEVICDEVTFGDTKKEAGVESDDEITPSVEYEEIPNNGDLPF